MQSLQNLTSKIETNSVMDRVYAKNICISGLL